jgi:hypothetical protein
MLNVTVWSTVQVHCSQKTATKFNLFVVETNLMWKKHNCAIPTIIGKTDCTLSYTNSAFWENQVNNCHEFKFLGRCVYPQDLFFNRLGLAKVTATENRCGLRWKDFLNTPAPSARDGPTKNEICNVWVLGHFDLYGIRPTPFGGARAITLIRCVRKIAKSDYPHGTTEFPLDGCNEIWNLRIFRKTREDSSFIEVGQE